MSTQDIFNEINVDKNTYPELQNLQPSIDTSQTLLDDLDSTSKVAFWRLIVWIIASRINDLQEQFHQHKAVVEQRSTEQILGNLAWYQKVALQFQYGYALQWNATKLQYEYPIEDSASRIIKLASANSSVSNQIVIKVANLSGTTPVQLTTPELDAAIVYMDKIKFAGCKVEIVSRPADLFRCNYKVYYDALVMNSDGSLITDPSIFPVEDAINSYLRNLPFDGVLSITSLTDAIQLADGVVNPVFQNAAAKYGAFAYTPITDYYNANAGYLEVDSNFPLTTSITYVV